MQHIGYIQYTYKMSIYVGNVHIYIYLYIKYRFSEV